MRLPRSSGGLAQVSRASPVRLPVVTGVRAGSESLEILNFMEEGTHWPSLVRLAFFDGYKSISCQGRGEILFIGVTLRCPLAHHRI